MKTTIATLVTALCIALASPQASAEQITCKKYDVCLKRTPVATSPQQSLDCELRYTGIVDGLLEKRETCRVGDGSQTTREFYNTIDNPEFQYYGDHCYRVISVTPDELVLDLIERKPAIPENRTLFE
jgi:hypothetical protein